MKNKWLLLNSLFLITTIYFIYSYQHLAQPRINASEITAHISKIDEDGTAYIRLKFVLENKGFSRTRGLVLYAAFIDWEADVKKVLIKAVDFSTEDILEVPARASRVVELDKKIKNEILLKASAMAGGFYCAAAFQWGSNNIACMGRTFNYNLLLFMKPEAENDQVIFITEKKKQEYITNWFLHERKPDLSGILSRLSPKEVLFGETVGTK